MAGTVPIKVDFDIAPFRREVDRFVRKQIPFARALAVTRVAFKARNVLRAEAPKHFTLRSKRLVSGIRSTVASKADPTASVGSLDDWMVLQAEGGTKTAGMASEGGRNKGPRGKGGGVGIPIRARGGKMKITRPTKWPGALFDKFGKKGRIFTEKGRGGSLLIYQIMGSLKNPRLRLMWSIKRSVKVPKRWPLEQTVERVMRKEWARTAVEAFEEAMKTAR